VTEPRAWLRRIAFRDFRNLAQASIELPEAGLAVIGENGQGKTNLLEGIYYMQVLRSVRGTRDQDLVRFGANGFHIRYDAHMDLAGSHELSVGFESAARRKRISIDGSVVTRLSDAFGSLPSVIFSPRDIQMIAGPASERRRFLDLVLALSSRRYLRSLQLYRATLARRNAALREASRGSGSDAAVAVWEPALAEYGATLVCGRAQWVRERAATFSALAIAMGEAGESLMSYDCVAARDADPRAALASALEKHRRLDIRRGMTHPGPHRDDLKLTLDGRELRVFGSAGQQRTAAIALRMLEGATLRSARGVEPLLLLDDPFAELDARRSARILELLRNAGLGQTVLVVPRESDIPLELMELERRTISGGVVEAAT